MPDEYICEGCEARKAEGHSKPIKTGPIRQAHSEASGGADYSGLDLIKDMVYRNPVLRRNGNFREIVESLCHKG